MEYLYKYPQQAFPYNQLREENRNRSHQDPEYELLDTGIFDKNEYFDVKITYAKVDGNDILIRIAVTNRFTEPAPITMLPLLWFYNRWSYGGLENKPNYPYNRGIPCLPNTNDWAIIIFIFKRPMTSCLPIMKPTRQKIVDFPMIQSL